MKQSRLLILALLIFAFSPIARADCPYTPNTQAQCEAGLGVGNCAIDNTGCWNLKVTGAPELDPRSVVTALALLSAGVMLLRARGRAKTRRVSPNERL